MSMYRVGYNAGPTTDRRTVRKMHAIRTWDNKRTICGQEVDANWHVTDRPWSHVDCRRCQRSQCRFEAVV